MRTTRDKQKESGRCDWRPVQAMLPDLATLERLSQAGGGQRQQKLFPLGQPDDSRAARLARLLADTLPNLTTADRLRE